MTSEQQNNLIFFRISSTDVRGYLSTIENTADNGLKLHVRSPQTIASLSEFQIPSPAISPPLYDYTQQLILFAAYGKAHFFTNSNVKNVDVWRIGPHLSLVSVERVQPLQSFASSPPGLVVHGGLIGISVPRQIAGSFPPVDVPMIAQRVNDPSPEGSGWSVVQYNTNTKDTSGTESRLFQSNDPEIKYVYHMKRDRWAGASGTQVFIEQMRASEYQKLATSKSSLWTSYDVNCGWKVSEMPAHAFTRSQYMENTPTKRRLYLFQLIGQGAAIEISYISLRPDGSVSSPNTAVRATQQSQIKLPPETVDNYSKQLQAVDLADGRIMLMWSKLIQVNGLYCYTPAAVVTSVDKDGALIGPWRDVSLEFETPIADNEVNVRWGAVIAPKEFAS
ncbi:hypothetical protein CKM354_000772400 [Cercospora kikuchii]|uniref:Uncharacterized protein n=1 Tax=Cercospora kikuchii TaxID=84275 RepID=A0A9P3CKP3_9PEZI|nr:uncharacterized protein CKM354_000772400 [Cercospora kikuchii]GIZ44528.1 hypothetical protein CKM354_000772400 [Cercospora kikuchii]